MYRPVRGRGGPSPLPLYPARHPGPAVRPRRRASTGHGLGVNSVMLAAGVWKRHVLQVSSSLFCHVGHRAQPCASRPAQMVTQEAHGEKEESKIVGG
ncbi:hypothetical protein NDU88_002058 [Pleurodeles waltl]|uniref:Uncharacterized protein n=1 Tax=Pleurodeles waltl TaxID=8319 RepID=A0AAV7UYG8_PLEWA|nr:hypothetical protein NDU88_002058 [Pleurodeles waltl]